MLEIILMTNGVRTTVHDTQNTAKLSEEVNLASKLEFTVSYMDESFDNVFPKLTRVIAYDTFPNDVVFEGYVYSSVPKASSDGKITKTVSATHILSRLQEACVVGFENASGNVKGMVQKILKPYNDTAKDEDKIYIGTGPETGGHPEVVHIQSATCFDAITQIVVTEAGWSFRARYSGAHWYLDISEDFGEVSDTDLISGVNLIDISKEINGTDLYTRIIPIGGASYIPSDKINPDMSTLSSSEGMPLTLYKYFGNTEPAASKIYIANEALEAKYPVSAKVVQYDDVAATDDTDFSYMQGVLHGRGAADAAKLTDIIPTYKVTAIDLARAGYDFDSLELNKMYRIVNNKIDVDAYLKVTSKKTDYSNPAKSDLTFGAVGLAASKWMSKKGKTADQKISDVGGRSYKTTNTRMGGMSMRNQTKTEYESAPSHDGNTLYTVSDSTSGKVEMYLGDTKISGEGGGVEVQTAALLDENNVHHWLADQELMLNIDATTRLLYGGNQRLVSVQGHVCRYGTGVNLYVDDVDNFGSKLELDVWWREDANSAYVLRHMVFEMFINMISSDSDGTLRWALGLAVYCYDPTQQPTPYSGQTAEWTQIFTTPSTLIPQPEHGDLQVKPIIIPTVTSMSFADTFSTTWSRITESASTPYGYCVCNNLRIYYGIWSNGMLPLEPITISRWWYNNNQVYLDACGYNKNPSYKCVPMESLAEKCFDLGLVQRSEPVTPNSGGGGNA